MISLSFYWSLAISQFFDVKRKDFWQMFIHHIATIALMAFSWVSNLHRVGTLVLLLHDCVDIFLEVILTYIIGASTLGRVHYWSPVSLQFLMAKAAIVTSLSFSKISAIFIAKSTVYFTPFCIKLP